MGRRILLSLAVLALGAPVAAAAQPGLPSVSSGHRPGPDALYLDAPAAPQLESAAPWAADPILISGASAYRQGEFLYQDFLYDDHGAVRARDNSYAGTGTDFLYTPPMGTLSYPTDPVFANNAADLVELRVKPVADATAFRVTLNTLKDPERTAFTIALGGSGAAVAWPHGAGVTSPAELFLTVHGATAELADAAGTARSPAPVATVDARRRQVDVRVAHAAWNPGGAKVRMAIGVGLWDPAAGGYLAGAPGNASATTPGGGSPDGAQLFNVGFRFAEPFPDVGGTGAGATMGDAAVGAAAQAMWWREYAQALALAAGDISQFFADVDFAKLAARTDDDSGVPRSGPTNRILASRFEFGQGVDHTLVCFDIGDSSKQPNPCTGRFVGQLQPYSLYVPTKPAPARGWGLTLLLHSLSSGYNQYSDSKNQSQLGERGAGSLVITPFGRGPDGFYEDVSEADTFEVWADVAHHYPVDADWVVTSGYSMGGFGTYRLAARWPDLFARAQVTVGTPGGADDQVESLRNVPIMTWSAVADELVPLPDTEEATAKLGALGLRFVSDLFAPADHLSLATNDEYGPAAEFLGEHRVDRNPAHVTYMLDPTEDSARSHVVADHAYWLSGLRARDPKATQRARIDARSAGFGAGDAPVLGVEQGGGALQGGSRGPLPYVRRSQAWGPAPTAAKADRLVVTTTNVAAATVDARRAKLSCAPTLDVSSDGPLDLQLSCPTARSAGCKATVRIKLPRVRGQRVTRVTVLRGRAALRRARGRNLRSVSVARPTRAAFKLRVKARTNRGRVVTVTRRFAACG